MIYLQCLKMHMDTPLLVIPGPGEQCVIPQHHLFPSLRHEIFQLAFLFQLFVLVHQRQFLLQRFLHVVDAGAGLGSFGGSSALVFLIRFRRFFAFQRRRRSFRSFRDSSLFRGHALVFPDTRFGYILGLLSAGSTHHATSMHAREGTERRRRRWAIFSVAKKRPRDFGHLEQIRFRDASG